MLTWILNNNTVRLSWANLNPRVEMRPSVGWNRLFKGLFLVEIEFKWLHERLNQTLVCRAAKLKLSCNLFTPINRIYPVTLSNSWFATTWQGGHVEGQNNRIFSWRIYLKTELSYQRREMLLFLTSNMAALTSRASQQWPLFSMVFLLQQCREKASPRPFDRHFTEKAFSVIFLGERPVNLLRFSVADFLSLMSLSSLLIFLFHSLTLVLLLWQILIKQRSIIN